MHIDTLPTFKEESKLWSKGYNLVIGIDEVGRGCFAGPIVASAVAFLECHPEPNGRRISEILRYAQNDIGIRIDDSKRLKPQERKKSAKWIKEHCLAYGIGEVGVATINKVGIGKAGAIAMRLAVNSLWQRAKSNKDSKLSALRPKPYLLIDAFYIPYTKGIPIAHQKAIKNGDQKSISIAAASILAKVYRDALMKRLSKKHPSYQWGRNKGYGTADHQEAIKKYGMTKLHRRMFVETFLAG